MFQLSGNSSTLFVRNYPGFVLQGIPLDMEPIFLTSKSGYLDEDFIELDIGDPVNLSYFYSTILPNNSTVISASGYTFSSTLLDISINNIYSLNNTLYIIDSTNIETIYTTLQFTYSLQSSIVLPTFYNTVAYVSVGCKEINYTITNGVLNIDIEEYKDTNAVLYVGLNIELSVTKISNVAHFLYKDYLAVIEYKDKTYTKQVGNIPNVGEFIQFSNKEEIRLFFYD